MAIDLKDLSSKELKNLATQIKKQQTALAKRKPIAGVRKKLIALANAAGYSIAELFGKTKPATAKQAGKPATKKAAGKASKKAPKKAARKTTKSVRKGVKVAPKYRNPADPKVVWTGRGRQPLWFADLLKKGKKAEELLIKK